MFAGTKSTRPSTNTITPAKIHAPRKSSIKRQTRRLLVGAEEVCPLGLRPSALRKTEDSAQAIRKKFPMGEASELGLVGAPARLQGPRPTLQRSATGVRSAAQRKKTLKRSCSPAGGGNGPSISIQSSSVWESHTSTAHLNVPLRNPAGTTVPRRVPLRYTASERSSKSARRPTTLPAGKAV